MPLLYCTERTAHSQMKQLRIGLVDLDTSHPAAWLPILRDLGHEVAGVFDGGTVYPAGYAAEFAKERQIPRVYESLPDMASDVDLAIIHTCNWDLHVERAKPFVEAGKSVLLDKPMVGNLRDLNQVLEWGRRGVRITGGSSLRYTSEIRAFRESLEAGETIRYVYSGTGVDEFNYGIHGYSVAQGLLGQGIACVRHLSSGAQHQIELTWENGARAILTVGAATRWLPFFATVITDRRIAHLDFSNRVLYRGMLEAVLPYLAGEAAAPAPLEELLECERAALAARASWRRGNTAIYLHDLCLDDCGYDGAAFGAAYRLSKIKP